MKIFMGIFVMKNKTFHKKENSGCFSGGVYPDSVSDRKTGISDGI